MQLADEVGDNWKLPIGFSNIVLVDNFDKSISCKAVEMKAYVQERMEKN